MLLPHVQFGRNDHREDAPHFKKMGSRYDQNLFLKIKKGEALAHGEGLDTNVWIIGVPELINRLESLLKDLMSQLGASEGTVFDAIGLSISGGSQPKMAENIKSQLKVISQPKNGLVRGRNLLRVSMIQISGKMWIYVQYSCMLYRYSWFSLHLC